jgi:hypothetical protein
MIINKKINDSTHVFELKKLDQDILFESWAQVVCLNPQKKLRCLIHELEFVPDTWGSGVLIWIKKIFLKLI